jgi:hypothetical protein
MIKLDEQRSKWLQKVRCWEWLESNSVILRIVGFVCGISEAIWHFGQLFGHETVQIGEMFP